MMTKDYYLKLCGLARLASQAHRWVSYLEYKAFLFGYSVPNNLRKR